MPEDRIRARIIRTARVIPRQSRSSESSILALATKHSLTLDPLLCWPDDEAVQAWYESAAPPSRDSFCDILAMLITPALLVKRLFRLTLRVAQGFIDSIFAFTGVSLCHPDYRSV